MTTAKRFEDLEVWQRAKDLTSPIYKYSTEDSFSRDFGLRDQLYIARDQGYLNEEDFNTMFSTAEIYSRRLWRFIQYLESQPNARRVREEGVTYNVEH